eukprot:CAMPEP_0202957556 /NCGR_PEP_ID=MMETSP1396-20130829/1923_1 /ASSEMBLY_ACC=CAM_ASM_000872 /TAXON_ID= /ORGANISM="Pseudokeronopsis sp., Strain Brazil" /LENGTH=138 /DNA_ID=CAMNT_0049675083 /DNA_START=1 /DNA_END=417 /DNA_ORIENTATION=-
MGKVLFGLMIIVAGYMMQYDQTRLYNKYLHALRKSFLPESMGNDLAPFPVIQLSYEQMFTYLIKADAYLFMLSGFLIISQKKLGAIFLILATLFVLATRDNPFIESNLKSVQMEQEQRQLDFVKHLGLIGGALILLGE